MRPDGTFEYYKDRWENSSGRREVLGSAFAVIHGVMEGNEAIADLNNYPVTAAGILVLKEDHGTFHELIHFKTCKVTGSGHQLWTAAAFVDTCRRAGLIDN